MCCVQWLVLGWLPPMSFWVFCYHNGNNGAISQLVKLSPNCLLLQVKSLLNLSLLALCNVTNFTIFFLWRKLKCKSSKSYAYGLPCPQQLRGWRGGEGGWVNLLKKENLWQKSFYWLMQNEVIKYCEIFYKYLKYCY